MEPALTRNERKVLSFLAENSRATDTEIALRLKISPQGARKIRKKLEGTYIMAYRTVFSYEMLGINVFAIAQMKVMDREVLKSKNIIGAFEINEANITHIFILGFESLEALDEYKVKIAQKAEIQRINVVSKKGFLKNSPMELIKDQLR